MHRLLAPTSELSSESPSLSKEAANHLKVLRPKEGECVELFDGFGSSRTFEFRSGSLHPYGTLRTLPRSGELTLFACVTKGSRWDWTIEKATELGVSRIVPVISERTIVRLAPDEREAKAMRWRRVAEDAARQSDALWLPEIMPAVSFAESLAIVRETTCMVGALTTPPPSPIGKALFDCGELAHPAVYVGPEGDFTPDELASLLQIATPVSLGSTILRAETAAIYALSAVKAFLDSHED